MNKKGMDGEEALALNELLGRLSSISLTDLAQERRDGLTPQDRMLADLRDGKETQVRALRGKTGDGRKRKKPKDHWRVAAKKRKLYYATTIKPWRSKQKARNLVTGAGWYLEQMVLWKAEARKKRDTSHMPSISEEEFVTHIYPHFVGRLPVFRRLDTSKGVSLENLYVVDCDTEAVLFDGSEWAMRANGYIL